MKALFLKSFQKSYNKRVRPFPSLDKQFEKRFLLFLESPNDPILKDHMLKGSKKSLRAFSVSGDMRVIYYIENNIAYFIDIGTHNQVY